MRRFLTWALGGIAVGVAARALTRATEPAVPAAPSDTGELAVAAPAAMIAPLAEVTGPVATDASPGDRIQTGLAFARLLVERLKAHTTTVIAGSLAYYALLTVFPAAIAAISIYGLVANPADLASLIESLADQLPEATSEVINTQLLEVVTASDTGLGIATAISVLTALYSASAGAKVLITGVNLAYGERETRSFLVVRGLALMLTLGMIVGIVIVVAGVAVLPRVVDSRLTGLAVWPGLVLLVIFGLAALYRIAPADAPGRNHPIWQGAFAAAVVWLAATALFSFAVTEFGRFNETYGTLVGVVVLMLWFFLSGLIVLLGAEFNAAIEVRRQRMAIARF